MGESGMRSEESPGKWPWADSGPWVTYLPTLWGRLHDVCEVPTTAPWSPPPYPDVTRPGTWQDWRLSDRLRDELAAWWAPALHLLRYALGCPAPMAALTRHLDRAVGVATHPDDDVTDHRDHPAWRVLDAWWGARLPALAAWGLLCQLDAKLGAEQTVRYGSLSRLTRSELERLASAEYLCCDGGGDMLHLSGHLRAPDIDDDLETVDVFWPDEADDDRIEVEAQSYSAWYQALRAFVHGTRYARVVISGVGELGTFRGEGGAPHLSTARSVPSLASSAAANVDMHGTGSVSGLKAGSVMETAMLGPVVAGHLRTWVGATSQLWRVDDPTGLAALLGRGLTSRTEVEPGRYREVGLLDSTSGSLLVPKRFTVGGEVETTGFALTRATDEPDRGRQWADFVRWLNLVALAAAERGDFLVVELGGWDHQPHPYALFAHTRVNEQSLSHLEVAPAPTSGVQPWTLPPERPDGATVTAIATRETISVAGSALVPAIQEWARSPLDLAVTFGTNPDGPVQLGSDDSPPTASGVGPAVGSLVNSDGGDPWSLTLSEECLVENAEVTAAQPAAESFTSFVQEQIGWYVYLLRDPRDGGVFYVGKGTGNRVFQHAQDAALLKDSEKPKLSRIRAIHAAGLQVVTELVRHHIPTEKMAYLVEAAVIDAMRAVGVKLSNEVQGHHSAVYGWASTAVAASVYDAPPLPHVDDALVMFKIPKLWTPAMTEAELYEATRGWWVLGPKARRAKYALAVHKGVTRGVWRIEYWRERVPGDRDYDPAEVPPRVGFVGTKAPEMHYLLNRSIKHLPQGAGAVTVYLNCADGIQPAELLTGAAAVSAAAGETEPA